MLKVLFVVLFVSGGLLYTWGSAVGSALFLASLPPERVPFALPWLYVGAAVVNVAAALAFDRMLRAFSRVTTLVVTQASLAVLFGLGFWFMDSSSSLACYAMTIGLDAASLLSLTLFFGLAGDYFTSRDARQMYALLAGAIAVGTIAGGELLSSLIARFGVLNLVLAYALTLLLNAGLCVAITHRGKPVHAENRGRREAPASLRVIFGNRFVMLVFVSFMLGMLLTVASAFQMQWLASKKPVDELAAFFGRFYTWVGAAELVVQFLLVPPLLRLFGVAGALMVPPVLVCGASLLMGLSIEAQLGLLSPLALSALVNGVRLTLEETLTLPARELLFLPLPVHVRARAQTLAGAVLAPLSRAGGGLLLLAYVSSGFGPAQLSFVTMFCSFLLALAMLALRPRYRDALFESLRSLRLGTSDLGRLMELPGADGVLRELLRSSDEQVVVQTLFLLGERSPPALKDELRVLAQHRSPEVARLALRSLSSIDDGAGLPAIEAQLDSPHESVSTAAAAALLRVAPLRARTRLAPMLDDAQPERADLALEALAHDPAAHADVVQRLEKRLASANRAERLRAVALIERVGHADVQPLLARLLHSHDEQERRAAALASARLGIDALLPALVEIVRRGELPGSALAPYGSRSLSVVGQCLLGSLSSVEHRRLLDCIASIEHPDALAMLLAEVSSTGDVLTRATAAEGARRLATSGLGSAQVLARVEAELVRESELVRRVSALAERVPGTQPELGALLLDHGRTRAEVLLSLCGFFMSDDEHERLRGGLYSASRSLQSSALELLDAVLPGRLAGSVTAAIQGTLTMPRERRESAALRVEEASSLGPWVSALVASASGTEAERALLDPEACELSRHVPTVLFLKRVALFSRLGGDRLLELARLCDYVALEAGAPLFAHGDLGDAMYIVCEGSLSVRLGERELSRLGPGQEVGEMALIDHEPRSAAALALVPTRVLRAPAGRFREQLEGASFRRALLNTLCLRLWGNTPASQGRESAVYSVMPTRVPPPALGQLVSVLAVLRESDLFADLPAELLTRVASRARLETRYAGEVLFDTGDRADALYVVSSGMVQLEHGGAARAQVLRGQTFGERALIAGELRAEQARVIQDADLVVLGTAALLRLFDEDAQAGIAMLRQLSVQLRRGTREHLAA